MDLAHLLYVSNREPSLTPDDLPALVAQSAANNAKLGITGVLLCRGRNLMQLLEGPMLEITRLFERIARDSRHSDVQQLLCKPVNSRLFPDWGMGLADFRCTKQLDRRRLARILAELRQAIDTSNWSIESRHLLRDFNLQLPGVPQPV